MSNWETKALSDLVIDPITYGIVQPGDFTKNGVPLIRGKDYMQGWAGEGDLYRVTPELHEKYKRSKVTKGDLLLSIAGYVGEVAIVPDWIEEANITQTTARIRCNEEILASKYLLYFLQSEEGREITKKFSKGSAQSGLNLADIAKFEIPLPPLPEQKKIAEILSGIDRKLYTCNEKLSRTNLLRTSLLKSMMQGAEEDSTERALGNIVEVINGRAYKLTEWESEGTPVIRLQNLTKQGGNFYYSNLQLPEKQYCEKGDLLFMWSASFGPHIWWGERAIYHYHIWKMLPKDNSLLKDYLYLFLQHKTAQWKSQGAGMAMIHLTKEGIEKEIIPLPPVAMQQRIVNAIKSIDDRIEAEKSKANKFSLLKLAISADLLSGRKRVSV